jgi:predicted DNA-binding transcriptional regulator
MEEIMSANEQRVEKRENIVKVMEESFVMVPAKLLRDVAERKITSSGFHVYCYLLFRQGKNEKYWGSIEDICWGTRFSSAQVSRLLKQLEKRGHIKRAKRVGATWLTYCLTRVDDREIIFCGKSMGGSFINSTIDRNTKSKKSCLNGKQTLRAFAEIHSGKPASENDIDEASRLFKETIPSDGTSEDARLDKLEREIDEIFSKP